MSINLPLIWLRVDGGACGIRQEEWSLAFLRGKEQFSLHTLSKSSGRRCLRVWKVDQNGLHGCGEGLKTKG